MSQILRMVSTRTNIECKMCNDTKLGKRWEYRSYQYIPSHLPKILITCAKCIYREAYGSKNAKKNYLDSRPLLGVPSWFKNHKPKK